MDKKTDIRYKRLPGRGPRTRGIITAVRSRCSLYLGDDHILAVDNNGFSESYKRFYFSDIQAFITQKTRRGAVWNIVLAVMIACSLVGALFFEEESLRILFWILSGIFFALLLINILKGPTCTCHIVTAVQVDKLPSLNRLRVARKVIDAIRPSIEKVQGTLSPEEITTGQSMGTAHPAPSLRGTRVSQGRQRQIRHYDGTIHMTAFALLLADGIVTGISLLYHTLLIGVVSSALTVMYTISIIIALVKQYGSDIPRSVRGVTWASLGFICISYILSYILMITIFMRTPHVMMSQWDMYRAMLKLSPQDSPFLMIVYCFVAVCALVLGALGLMGVKRHRDASTIAPAADQNKGGERQT
jgi:hypothetical protein